MVSLPAKGSAHPDMLRLIFKLLNYGVDTIQADETNKIVLEEATKGGVANAVDDMIVSGLVYVYYETISYDCAR